MTNNVYWILETTIKEGEYEAFEALMAEMVAATRENEPGTLFYEWFVGEDKKTCHLYERYADSAAVFAHLENFRVDFGKRFWSLLTQTRWTVYGDATEDLKNAIGRFGAVFMESVGGFSRSAPQ